MVLTPIGRDSAIAASILKEARLPVWVCAGLTDLVAALREGAGVGLLAEEALHGLDWTELAEWLADQPAWSDFPFIVLSHRGGGLERNPSAGRLMKALGNVTFLERPFHPTTLVSVVRTALRGRLRQYEARERIEEIHEAEARFRTMVESIPQLAWMAHPDGEIFWFNQRWYDYTGMRAEELGQHDMRQIHDPEIRPRVLERWRRSLDTGERFEMVFPLRSATGEYRAFLSQAVPLRDDAGRVVRWFGTNTDVTEQQQMEALLEQRVQERTSELASANRQLAAQIAERERVQSALRQSQRLEAVGQLTSGVAHDFNNLLTVVLGNVRQLQRGSVDSATARRLDMIGQAAERGAKLTAQMLAFSRRQKLEPRAVDLNETVRSMRDLLQSTLGGGVRIVLEQEPNLWTAMIDPTQIELVILNLAINARDAMDGGGKLTVKTGNVTLGAPEQPEEPAAGDYVMLSVADTGAGMSDEVRSRVFEPFFTTKDVGKGSGLGLSQVFGLAKQSGGGVRIDTKVGEGTSVCVFLPRTRVGVEEAQSPSVNAPPRADTEVLILVVDDDSAVREVTASILGELGYRVIEAGSGGAALDLLDRNPDIRLVLLDFAMPGMNGAEVSREILARRPEMPILFATGYADAAALAAADDDQVLQKPFEEDELAYRVARCLEEPTAH